MNNIHEQIVLVGGGGGVYRVARFLKHIRRNITTIQTMFDHGGHSGELRDERGVLPPGDIRQAILALADDTIESELRALLAYRFAPKNSSALDDVTVGNIMLTALSDITGSMIGAIHTMCRWFRISGNVLPVSLSHSELCAVLSDGTVVHGEGLIDTRSTSDDRMITRVFLKPTAHIYTPAYEALISADKIIFCPGDLYTSIVPNVLVSGFCEAIKKSRAQLVFVVNIMTKKAETHRFTASCFAKVLLSYLGRDRFDAVICNNSDFSPAILARYRSERARPVRVDLKRLQCYAKRVVRVPLVDESGGVVRHHEGIATTLAEL
ncbi:MAG: hypothetical protein G01um101417_137 [Parcubacteria group bacterium Gr01-1014_17]|nr:MAG: hypothetical protein G01um101417_137 [Parcubacteria group bacterium Gr01-1014_17]